jgi:hypothetical protein
MVYHNRGWQNRRDKNSPQVWRRRHNFPKRHVGRTPHCLEDLWVKAREAKGARKRFFEHIRTITAYLVFPDWHTLMTTLINSKPPPEIEKQIAG